MPYRRSPKPLARSISPIRASQKALGPAEMHVEVTHVTRYRYQPRVEHAQHVAYLTPLQAECQQLLSHRLEIDPLPDECESRPDLFGNTRTFFTILAPHQQVSVTAHSVVATMPRPPVLSSIKWPVAQACFQYRAHAPYHPATEFTFASPYVPVHPDFLDYALSSFTPDALLLDCAFDLLGRIHRDFAYVTNSTQVHTTALEALALRQGVCQDFAHIMIACWRAMGLPARYVSGYLLTHPPVGQPRLIGADASHAWASVFVPQLSSDGVVLEGAGQWLDFDPTNNRNAGEDYVTLGLGRDFGDVSPLRGVILGGADHLLEVEVTVTPLPLSHVMV
jgi:transglutaminase-like putative cysteine protease